MMTKRINQGSGTFFLFKKRFKTSGFTLVEVIIVIAIIGILATVAYPALSKWMPNYRLKSAARALYSDLQKAKLHAVKSNEDVLFTFTPAGPAPCSGGSYTFTEGANSVASNTMASGICLTSSTFNNGVSGFSSRGLPANNNGGVVVLTHEKLSGKTHSISQSLAGVIRIY